MLTLFFRILSVLCVAWAKAPEAPTHMDYNIDANIYYFTTDSNYTAGGGSTQTLSNSGYFQDIIATGIYTQDLDNKTRVYGGFNYSTTESYDGFFTRSNNGFNELMAGGQYWMKVLNYPVVPSADLVYPVYRVSKTTNDSILGEGAIKLRFGGWFMMGNKEWDPFLYLGYEYRDEGRAHAIPYNIGVKWKNKPWWAQVEYRGYERMFAGADTDNRNTRDAFLQRVNGGSYRYYAINPSLSEAAAEAGYSFGKFGVYGGAAITVNGSSAANGYSFLVGAVFTPGAENEEVEHDKNSPVDIPDRFTPSVESFDDLDPTKPPPKRSRPKQQRPVQQRQAPPPPPISNEELPTDVGPMPPPAPAPKKKVAPGGPMPEVQLRPAPKKAPPVARPPAPKPKPKPKPKSKTDKLLDEAEENLKSL